MNGALAKIRKITSELALTTEEPHFEKTSFRVKKKIYATFDERTNLLCVKLNEADQSVFCAFKKELIYPVPNSWGKQGWTLADTKQIPAEMLKDLLHTAWQTVQKKS